MTTRTPVGTPFDVIRTSSARALSSQARTAIAARRIQLMTRFPRGCVIAAGVEAPRNYAANPFPFRASSHFIYFVGRAIEGAFLVFDGSAATLFAKAPTQEDELWHGPLPSLQALEEELGISVRPAEELPETLQGYSTLPVLDARTAADLSKRLGRPLTVSKLDPHDFELANAVIDIRLTHDEHAQSELRAAAAITHEVHLAGMRATRPGVRESDIHAAMLNVMSQEDVAPAYLPIVTVHGEVLHNHGYTNVTRAGDLVLADVGAESRTCWASDVTRGWPVSGVFSSTQAVMYDVVLEMQRTALEKAKPGTRYRDIHLAACRVLASKLIELGIFRGDADELVADGATALFFPHGVGHLIGLDVHDMEDLGEDRVAYAAGRVRSKQFGLAYLRLDRDLHPGMAVTIEPGFYQVPAILRDPTLVAMAGDRLNFNELAKYADVRGIRIEDDILVTSTGHEVLTAAIPKTREGVERAMA